MQHSSTIRSVLRKNITFKEVITNETELIQLLVEWASYAEEQACMHDQARTYYRTFNYTLALPAIVLSTIGGTGNIGVSSTDCSNTTMLNIVFGSLGLASATLFTIHRYLNLPEYQQQHDFYSDEFEKLAKEINLQLIIRNDSHRTYASLVEFAKECKKMIDVIIDKAPPIPKHISRREERKRGRKLTKINRVISVICCEPPKDISENNSLDESERPNSPTDVNPQVRIIVSKNDLPDIEE
jgi:hypothetical protein